jgi:hypothetical protein
MYMYLCVSRKISSVAIQFRRKPEVIRQFSMAKPKIQPNAVSKHFAVPTESIMLKSLGYRPKLQTEI